MTDSDAPASSHGWLLAGWDAGVAVAAGLLAGIVYWSRRGAGVLPGDSGEFQFAAWLAGLQHPTGYPLYMLLGWAWSHLLAALGSRRPLRR